MSFSPFFPDLSCIPDPAFLLCAKKCNQCLFSAAKIVSNSAKADIIKTTIKDQSHFVCHKGTIAGGRLAKLCCRGYFNSYGGGISHRFALAVGIPVVEIYPETMKKKTENLGGL